MSCSTGASGRTGLMWRADIVQLEACESVREGSYERSSHYIDVLPPRETVWHESPFAILPRAPSAGGQLP